MDPLYEDIKKARLRLKPDRFVEYLEEKRDAFAAATKTAPLKKLQMIAKWATKNDVVMVVQCLATRLDIQWLWNSIASCLAWNSLRWLGGSGLIQLPLPPNCGWWFCELVASGNIELLDWIAANTANFACSDQMVNAARSGSVEMIAWCLDHGDQWTPEARREVLKVGILEALHQYDFRIEDFGQGEALTSALARQPNPAITEWVLAKVGPQNGFDFQSLVWSALDCSNVSLLRWLHETVGVGVDKFRTYRGATLSIHMWDRPLELLQLLQEICQFTREDAGMGHAHMFGSNAAAAPETVQWIQNTFQFSLEELRAGRVLQRACEYHSADTLIAILQMAPWAPEDWMHKEVLGRMLWTRALFPAAKWCYQSHPFTPEELLHASPLVLRNVINRGHTEALTWLHEVVGVRSDDPELPRLALKRWDEKQRLSILRVLADTYGIGRIAPCDMFGVMVSSPKTAKVLHDKFGVTAEYLRDEQWSHWPNRFPEFLEVCTETYGMTCREIREKITTLLYISPRALPILANTIGMSAEDWRRNDYAALRDRTRDGDHWDPKHFKQLFEVYDMTGDDAAALLTTPNINPRARRLFQRLARQYNQ